MVSRGPASWTVSSSTGCPGCDGTTAPLTHMDSVGLRQLRRNAGRVIARVAAGETFIVTDRGRHRLALPVRAPI